MKLPVVRKIFKEDISKAGEAPDWVDALLDPLNQFLDRVTLALRNNLDLANNFSGKLIETKFTHNVTLNVNPGTNGKILGIVPMGAGQQAITSFKWIRNDDGTVGITFGFAAGGSTADNCTLFIFYGA